MFGRAAPAANARVTGELSPDRGCSYSRLLLPAALGLLGAVAGVGHARSALEAIAGGLGKHIVEARLVQFEVVHLHAGIVESRREGTWVYYKLSEQDHDAVQTVLSALTKSFGAERALRADNNRLRKSCGPSSCK